MTYQKINGIHVFSADEAQQNAVTQMESLVQHTAAKVGDVAGAALMADHHLGYSQPIGGVVAMRDHVSPSGVSDLFCVYRGREHDVAVLRPAGAVGASSRSHANAAGCRARGPGTPPHGHQPPR